MRTAAKTALFMAVLTLLSKIMGFLREVFMAGFFGTSFINDAYVMATAIPGIIFAGIFTSVSVSYMPIFSETVEKRGIKEGNKFTSEAITIVAAIAIIISILGIVFSDQVISIFAAGYEGETAALTSFYLKITFSQIIFTGAIGLLKAYLEYKGIFLAPIVTGYLQSGFILITIIIGAIYSHYLLPWGVLIGSILHIVALWFVAYRKGFKYTPSLEIGDSTKKIVALAIPVFIGSTVNQVNSFVDKMLASGLSEGSVGALNYANLLIQMIITITITVIVTIIYPRLTQSLARDDFDRFNDFVSKGMNIIVIIALPCALGAMLYSEEVISLIYERGAFDATSTDLTGSAFFFYAIGLTFIALNAFFVKIFYSMQDMRTPVICGAIGAAINIVANLLLIGPMEHRGLALGTSIAAFVNLALLNIMMRRRHAKVRLVESRKKLLGIVFSAIISVALSYIAYCFLADIPMIAALLIAVIVAAVIYLVLLKFFKVEELEMLKNLINVRG